MDEDKARVSYECASCQGTGETSADIKHTSECKNKIGFPKKICAKTGQAPHATVEAKK